MASSSRARAALIASGILLATPAAAQSTDTPAPPPAAPPAKGEAPPPPPQEARPMNQQPDAMTTKPQPRRAPRRGATPPRAKGKHGHAAPAAGAPIASAPAFFRLEDGSTRISVEVTSKVDVAESRAQGRLVYRIKGAYAAGGVNRLPLLTGFFATPVDRAQLVQDGPDVELVIDLREASTPAHRVVETPRGIVLQVDFPRSASADHAGAPGETSRERAKRRSTTQTLGTDRGDGGQGDDSR